MLILVVMAGIGVRNWMARRPTVIFVAPFTAPSGDLAAAALAERLTTATRVALGATRTYQVSATDVRADLAIRGHARAELGSATVQVSIHNGTGDQLWSATLGGDTGRLIFLVPQSVADAVDVHRTSARPK